MSLKSMKRRKEKPSKDLCASPCGMQDKYHYGLQISLNEQVLKALGIKSLPPVGTKMIVVGVGEVVRASERETYSGVDRDLDIQLQELDIGKVTEDEAASAEEAIDKVLKDL